MNIYLYDIEKTNYATLLKYENADWIVKTKKIDSLKRESDKKLSLGAGLLLLDVLKKDYGINPEYIRNNLLKAERGKPYLKDSNVFFNISHTQNRILLAVSVGKNVGVDIEKIRSTNEKVANRCFSKNEIGMIEKAKNKDELYTTIWTLKESYVKLTGTGIGVDLKKTDTEYIGEKKYYCKMLGAYFLTLKEREYCLSICSNNSFEYKIKNIDNLK